MCVHVGSHSHDSMSDTLRTGQNKLQTGPTATDQPTKPVHTAAGASQPMSHSIHFLSVVSSLSFTFSECTVDFVTVGGSFRPYSTDC